MRVKYVMDRILRQLMCFRWILCCFMIKFYEAKFGAEGGMKYVKTPIYAQNP